MLIVGLTGSLGMGKSTAAEHLRKRGIAVFDADAAVHALYAGEAAAAIERAFPGTTANGVVDRARLSKALLAAPHRFAEIEAIVHPLVRAAEQEFLHAEFERGASIAALEIPLLFETARDERVDATIVVSAAPEVQRERLLKRPGMTHEKIDALLERQMADVEKRARADFVVDTGRGEAASGAALDAILEELRSRRGDAYERYWAG